jgi:hypothetical protein
MAVFFGGGLLGIVGLKVVGKSKISELRERYLM